MEKPKTALAFDERARAAIRRGVDAVAEAVKVTLGPLGRNVAFEVRGGPPKISHDGMTVAAEIRQSGIHENLSVRLVKHGVAKTNSAAGDGTTTTVVLTQALVHEGLRLVAAGVSPVLLRREIECAARAVDEALWAMAVPAAGRQTYQRIATIAGGDPEIGRVLGEAVDWTGPGGTVAIIEGRTSETRVELTEGFLFDRGFISPHFVTHEERDEAVVDDPGILLTDQTISAAGDLLPILEQLLKVGKRDVVVIARDVTGEALALLVQNKLRGIVNALAVKAPEFDERRTAALDDLALVTGATLLSEQSGRRPAEATLDDLGRADQVVSRRERMTVVGGRGSPEAVRVRINQIKGELAVETVRFHREKLEARLVRLGGRVAEIRVGAPTALALKEKKARFDDAHHALRAAIEEGVVPGGGVALLQAAVSIGGLETAGAGVLRRALEQPLRQLAENAGEEGAVIAAEVRHRQRASGNAFIGYDALDRRFGDLREAGIVDPLRVTRSALRNAVSIAALLLTSEVLVAHVPIDEVERRRKQRKPWPGLAAGH